MNTNLVRLNDLPQLGFLTLGHVVIAGARTHRAILDDWAAPLPGHMTIVLSRLRHPPATNALYCITPETALIVARGIEEFSGGDDVFLISGRAVNSTLFKAVDRIYLADPNEGDTDDDLPSDWLSSFELTSYLGPPSPMGNNLPTVAVYQRRPK